VNPRPWTSHHRDALLTRVTVLTAGTAVLGTAGAMGLAVGLVAAHPSTKATSSSTTKPAASGAFVSPTVEPTLEAGPSPSATHSSATATTATPTKKAAVVAAPKPTPTKQKTVWTPPPAPPAQGSGGGGTPSGGS